MVRISKHISNIVFSVVILISMSCKGMEWKHELATSVDGRQPSEVAYINYLTPESRNAYEKYGRELHADITKKNLEEKMKVHRNENFLSKIAHRHFYKKELNREQQILRYEFFKNYVDEEPIMDKIETVSVIDTVKNPIKGSPWRLDRVPVPRSINFEMHTIIAKNKIDSFKTIINTPPTIIVVKDLIDFNNPDLKKIREIGNYTLFGDGMHKWVIDNNTGFEVVLSQEIIEKLMQLSTKSIQTMIDHDCFDETNINNCLKHQIN